jgi:hypothetical protein
MNTLSPVFAFLFTSLLFSTASAASLDHGRLSTKVVFLKPAGSTVTNEFGIFYSTGGSQAKIYAPEYWGTFPLYFAGTTMHFTLTVTNNVAQGNKPYNLRFRAISNVLKTVAQGGGLGVWPRRTDRQRANVGREEPASR